MKFAIADPPYPPQLGERYDLAGGAGRLTFRSRARRWYGDGPRDSEAKPADFHPDAHEWDRPARHRLLLEQLHDEYDGWAIATCPDGLHHYGELPPAARLLVWIKPRSMPTANRVANSWEPVIVYTPPSRRGRAAGLRQIPDVLTAPAPGGGFAGAKPPEWTRWVLDALAYNSDTDELHDLFPGSGAVASAAAQGVLL